MLYIIYSIIDYKYKDYKISSHIKYIEELNSEISDGIDYAKELIEYKKSNAYINKMLKQDQNYKNEDEVVIYLTTEEKYNKYTNQVEIKQKVKEIVNDEYNITKWMTIYQKWIYFIFQKDIR